MTAFYFIYFLLASTILSVNVTYGSNQGSERSAVIHIIQEDGTIHALHLPASSDSVSFLEPIVHIDEGLLSTL